MAEDMKTYKVKLTEENTYQVKKELEPSTVRILMLKGDKGDKGDPGESATNYAGLINKPQINDVTLQGNKTFEDLGAESLTNIDIENIINSIV